VTWGFIDLIAILLLYLALAAAIGVALRQWTGLKIGTEMEDLTLSQRQSLTIANMAVSVLVLLVSLPLMALRPGTSWRSFGWSLATLGRDVRLGLIGFVMLAPPVYAIQGVLVYFWKPSEHPLMEMFKGTPDAAFFATLVAAAVIVAPLVEEMLFRVFLQGFLEKLVSFRGRAQELVLGHFGDTPQPAELAAVREPVLAQAVDLPPDLNPYTPPSVPQPIDEGPEAVATDPSEQAELRGPRSWVPIGISSIIFALLHMSHGPDWVALTLLAAGMGYLYQRTHSIVPSLVIHMCLNGLSMWGLWIQVYELKGAGLGG
jgi:membrane protease YdiL (CAAX protease family)